MFNVGFHTHYLTLCTVFVLTVALTSPLCSLLAATMRRSFGSRGRCGLRVLTSYSSEYRYRYTRTPVRKPRLDSALLLISPSALSSPPCIHTNTQASDTLVKTGSEPTTHALIIALQMLKAIELNVTLKMSAKLI